MSEFLVDVHGLRTFRVSDDGHLLPVTAMDDSWRGGTCIARCRREPGHQPPDDDCRCGIYSFRHLPILRAQYQQALDLVAVVALEGQTLEGSRGWRSQAARVLDIWVSPDAVPNDLRNALAANLPDVRFHDDVEEMIGSYPDLSTTPPPVMSAWGPFGIPSGPNGPFLSPAAVAVPTARRSPAWPNLRMGRVPAYLLGVALFTTLFVVSHNYADRGPLGLEHLVSTVRFGLGAVGDFLARHSQNLLFVLILIGSFLRMHVQRGWFATGLTWLLRVVLPLIVAAVIAAFITGGSIEYPMPATMVNFFFVFSEFCLFVSTVGRMDGPGGAVARGLLRVARGPRKGRTTGVNYTGTLLHPLARYPLVLPVHFEPS